MAWIVFGLCMAVLAPLCYALANISNRPRLERELERMENDVTSNS